MTSHLLATHLNQQQERISGMLTPGARTMPGRQSLSALFRSFGGLKFQLAARKMRSLDPAKLGSLQPAKILRPLFTPFEEAKGLLHLKPVEEEGTAPWSEVETVFPVAQGESEPAPREGELRQGSIIPRMPTFPKPGEDLQAFREKVERRPKTSAPAVEPSKPHLSPNARLFSRVQEFQTKTAAEDLATPPVSDDTLAPSPVPEKARRQKDIEQKPPAEPSMQPVKEEITVRRAAAPAVPAPPPAKVSSQQLPPRETPVPTQPETHQVQPPSRLPEKRTVRPAKTPEKKTAPLPEAKPSALPRQKAKEAPLVRPLASKKKPPAEAATPAPIPEAPAPQKPSIVKPSRAAVPAPTEPEKDVPHLESAAPASMPDLAGVNPPPVSPETGILPAFEAPVRTSAEYRRQAPARVRSLDAEKLKPQVGRLVQHQPQKPLIPPQKYHAASPAAIHRQPAESPAGELPHPAPIENPEKPSDSIVRPQAQLPKPEVTSLRPSPSPAARPVPMALAYPPRPAASKENAQVVPTPAGPPIGTSQQSSQAPATINRSPDAANVIQRKWPENEGGAAPSTGGGGGAAPADSGGAGAAAGTDLAQLAEDVFPYVKRLIEIESDRLATRFH